MFLLLFFIPFFLLILNRPHWATALAISAPFALLLVNLWSPLPVQLDCLRWTNGNTLLTIYAPFIFDPHKIFCGIVGVAWTPRCLLQSRNEASCRNVIVKRN
jgi:hypothetical protein